jgi:hypothetical protein
MSNHEGGHMLNKVLILLEKYGFFDNLTQEKIESFANAIDSIGNGYDCNAGEIFDEIGKRIKYCYYCRKFSEEINDDGICKKCTQRS